MKYIGDVCIKKAKKVRLKIQAGRHDSHFSNLVTKEVSE